MERLTAIKVGKLRSEPTYRTRARLREAEDVVVLRAEGPSGAVCLKIAKNDARRASLRREGSVLARLEPLGGPALLDAGLGDLQDDGFRVSARGSLPFLAIQWIEGASPAPSSPVKALAIIASVADRLAALHALGLAHGDVKPENIVVDTRGNASLVDYGLAGSAEQVVPHGGTLRYLERDPRAPARSRDLFALGVTLAELLGISVDPSRPRDARLDALGPEVRALVAALIHNVAAVRPDAVWLAGRARTDQRLASTSHAVALVRASYVGTFGAGRFEGAPAWIDQLADKLDRLAAIGAPDETEATFDVEGVRRWLGAMVGPAATKWPCARWATLDRARLLGALDELAQNLHPRAFTYRLVDAALGGKGSRAVADGARPIDLALRLGHVPVDAAAIDAVERTPELDLHLAMRGAEVLRGQGQAGRAALLLAPFSQPAVLSLRAALTRRAGDVVEAERLARLAEEFGDARGTAVRARLLYDRGDVSSAHALVSGATEPACAEVEALCCAANGRLRDAEIALDRVEGAVESPTDRARLSGARGFVLSASDPARALEHFRKAVDLAELSGSVEDEATYLTGVASSAVDTGHLGEAAAAAERATLLWCALGRTEMATRAILSHAAALGAAARVDEAVALADRARAFAIDIGDVRATAYAELAALDVLAEVPADRLARVAALLQAPPMRAPTMQAPALSDGDVLHVGARLLRRGALAHEVETRLDVVAGQPGTDDQARLEWWTARARTAVTRPALLGAVQQITPLLGGRAPLHVAGRAAHAASEIADHEGMVDAPTLHAVLRARARDAIDAAGERFRDAVSALPWVAAAPSDLGDLPAAQVAELDKIVRLLTSGERLGDLLSRVVDALILWTGAERGLLLSRAPDGSLVIRTARNTSRRSLAREEIALSRTLASRALETREPVIAVDALGESSPEQASVHALRLRSVLAVPLVARDEVLGVVYLDDRAKKGTFGPRELSWVKSIATVAAALIQAARAEATVKRANARERRALGTLEQTLAEREARVDLAMRAAPSAEKRTHHASIVGESRAIVRMVNLVDRVAASDVPVLVRGESGSGKELVARAIHAASTRAKAPFVSENTSAIPETLLESALFGHTRGAFTGADRTRIGLFEAADGGTFFLDEIGEMSLGMQAKLLRVLEDGIVRPLGSERSRKVDVRIVAATHRDLEQMVKDRTFREDLYYRLDIVSITVPPLRERKEDVALLAAHFAAKHGRSTVFTREALAALSRFSFPGNVRQLENEVRRAIVLSDGIVGVEHLSPEVVATSGEDDGDHGLDVKKRVLSLERRVVREALEKTGGNQTRAAKLLGLSRFGLQKMMKRLDVHGR